MSQKSHSGLCIAQRGSLRVIECDTCNFLHLDPIPTYQELEELYREQYYSSMKPDYLASEERELTYLRISYEDRIKSISRLTAGRRLLDVGCGGGSFMRWAQDKGWDVCGLEPSEQACNYARSTGLHVIQGTLDKMPKQSSTFDVLHLKNVLEHVADPQATLSRCRLLLKPEGVLFVEVPNDFNLFQKLGTFLLKEEKSWIQKEHISYFNFSSLERLLEKTGFQIEYRTTTFPMYLFLCLGFNFIKYPKVGSICHQIRVFFEQSLYDLKLDFIRRFFYIGLSKLGLGRTVILYAKRQP